MQRKLSIYAKSFVITRYFTISRNKKYGQFNATEEVNWDMLETAVAQNYWVSEMLDTSAIHL